MSRNYYHSRWNNENWYDDGHCLRFRKDIKMGDVDIATAHISYDPHRKTAHGVIDFIGDKKFGKYTLSLGSGQCLRQFHGQKCVPKMQQYIENFIENNYAQICRWYYGECYYMIQRDYDREVQTYRYKPNEEEYKLAWEWVESVDAQVIEVEKVC